LSEIHCDFIYNSLFTIQLLLAPISNHQASYPAYRRGYSPQLTTLAAALLNSKWGVGCTHAKP